MLVTRADDTEDEPEGPLATLGGAGPESWWDEARCNDQAGTMVGLVFSAELQDSARAVPRARRGPSASRAPSSGTSRGACGAGRCSSTGRSS